MQDRSIVISTYALCGFANLSSVGMVIGAMSAMAPNRRPDIAALAFRAMLVGCVVSFMNACVASKTSLITIYFARLIKTLSFSADSFVN